VESSQAWNAETQALLAQLRAFCFPSGEDAVRKIDSIETTQRGELRTVPGATDPQCLNVRLEGANQRLRARERRCK
jgi:hypothetical protein